VRTSLRLVLDTSCVTNHLVSEKRSKRDDIRELISCNPRTLGTNGYSGIIDFLLFCAIRVHLPDQILDAIFAMKPKIGDSGPIPIGTGKAAFIHRSLSDAVSDCAKSEHKQNCFCSNITASRVNAADALTAAKAMLLQTGYVVPCHCRYGV
jgi:hypothetical protein